MVPLSEGCCVLLFTEEDREILEIIGPWVRGVT